MTHIIGGMDDEKRGRGRPAAEDPRSKTRGIRFTEAEDALIVEVAHTAGDKPSEWIRTKAVAAAKRTHRRSGAEDA